MEQISIKNSKLDTINFIEENILSLRGKKIFLSSSLINDIWEKCDNENGEIRTSNLNGIYGILRYTFVFPAPENSKANGNSIVKIVDCGYNEKMRRYKLIEIKSNNFHYEAPKPLISQSLYLNNSEIAQTKTQDRSL